MKFKILTNRIPKYKKGDVVETRDRYVDPKRKVMMTLVRQGEASIAGQEKKEVTKKSKKK